MHFSLRLTDLADVVERLKVLKRKEKGGKDYDDESFVKKKTFLYE